MLASDTHELGGTLNVSAEVDSRFPAPSNQSKPACVVAHPSVMLSQAIIE